MSGITITAPVLTTWGQQNVAGTAGTQGFFPYAWRANPNGPNFSAIQVGWTVVGQPTWVVSAVGDGTSNQTITISGGTFTPGTFYAFTGGNNYLGGVTFGQGVNIGAGSAPGPSGSNGVVGYSEMPPPVVPGTQLQDSTATVNGSVGFTINNSGQTGVAITGLTANNASWVTTNYTAGSTHTCTWGAGSTVASSSVTVTNLPNGSGLPFVFFILGQTGAATYNYPFTFSI